MPFARCGIFVPASSSSDIPPHSESAGSESESSSSTSTSGSRALFLAVFRDSATCKGLNCASKCLLKIASASCISASDVFSGTRVFLLPNSVPIVPMFRTLLLPTEVYVTLRKKACASPLAALGEPLSLVKFSVGPLPAFKTPHQVRCWRGRMFCPFSPTGHCKPSYSRCSVTIPGLLERRYHYDQYQMLYRLHSPISTPCILFL